MKSVIVFSAPPDIFTYVLALAQARTYCKYKANLKRFMVDRKGNGNGVNETFSHFLKIFICQLLLILILRNVWPFNEWFDLILSLNPLQLQNGQI